MIQNHWNHSSKHKLVMDGSYEDHKNELFEFLSKKDGTDFNIIDSKGWSPIQRSIIINNVEIMKLLIFKSKGTTLNTSSCFQRTPLTYAISNHRLEIIEQLIDSGANVNQEDNLSWTPLTMATSKGNLEIIALLSRNGANLDLPNSKNYTPMIEAIDMEKLEVTKHLIDCELMSISMMQLDGLH